MAAATANEFTLTMKMMLVAAVSFIGFINGGALAHPHRGIPTSISPCDEEGLIGRDGVRGPPQPSPSPYHIVVPGYYKPGETINVSVIPREGAPPLKGILLKARDIENGDIVGTWTVTDPVSFKTVSCGRSDVAAVTHLDAANKSGINTFTWTGPPTHLKRDVYMTATFIQSYTKYWTGQKSSIIKVVISTRSRRATACAINHCENGGTCNSSGDGQISCTCPEGYTGDFCQTGATTRMPMTTKASTPPAKTARDSPSTPTPTTPTPTTMSNGPDRLSAGAIAGIVIGALAVAAANVMAV